MKKLLTLILFSGMAMGASAQLVNNGGSIVVEDGATLVVESDITNNGSGSIVNNGTIEVKGNLTSLATATFNSSNTNAKLKFSGMGASTLNLNNITTIRDLEMAKDDENLTLGSGVIVTGALTFTEDDNQIILGTNDLVLTSSGTSDNSTVTNSFVVTNGTGVVTKESLSGAFEFPVGAAIDSQNDITLTETGTTDNISVRVLANAYDTPATQTDVIADEVVNATWEITEATAGGSSLTAAPSWVAADETGTFENTDAAVYQFDGSDYTALAATGASTLTSGIYTLSNTGLVLNGTDYVIVADKDKAKAALLAVKMFLQGPYSTSTSLMGDQLRAAALIPTEEPYDAMASFTHVGGEVNPDATDFAFAAGTSDDIVDWVFVELRDGSDAVVATRSALLRRDGNVVDVDGNAVKFSTPADGAYSVVLRHRNHLGVKSASTVNMAKGTTATFDFSTGAAQSVGGDQPDLGSGVYGMWGGDTSGDGTVRYLFSSIPFPAGTPSDADAILFNGLSNVPNGSSNTYSQYDVNMDGTVRYLFSSTPFPVGTPSDADAILFNTLQNVPNSSKSANY